MTAKIPPKPSKEVIYLDVDDEITSIIDKVENAEQKVVALVLPKRAASLQSIVNMKLLKRSSDAAAKKVVLITSEAALLPLAGAAGLHVAKNLQTKPEVPDMPDGAAAPEKPATETVPDETEDEDNLPGKFDYGKPVGALAVAHEAENPETIDLDDGDEESEDKDESEKPKSPKKDKNKVKVPNFDKFRLMLGLGILAFVALVVFIILALFVLPKATITVNTTSEPVSSVFSLHASPGAKVDAAKGTIPAKLETSDQTNSTSAQATGKQNNGSKATGTVAMSTCVNSPGQLNDIPAGTGISTNGLNYITQQSASFSYVPGGSSCFEFKTNSVDITAQQGGSNYNTSISGASVAGYSGVSADGSASGGTDNIVTTLSQSDVDAAKQKILSANSSTDFEKNFEKQLASKGEYVLTSTLKAGDPNVTASPSVGQPATTANVTVKITYTVLTIKKDDLSKIIEDKLASQINKSKQKLNGNFLNDANISITSQSSSSSAVLSVNEQTTAVPIITVASVQKLAEGNKSGDIRAAITSWNGVKSVDVKLSPFWVSKVPKKASKVKVIIQEVKSSSSSSSNNSGS